MFKKILFLLTVIFSVSLFSLNSSADLGDFNNYSADPDVGGYSGSYGGDYSGGGYGGYGSYSRGYGYGYGMPSGGVDIGSAVVIVLIIFVIVFVVSRRRSASGSDSTLVRQGYNIDVPDNTEQIVAEILKNDSNFSNEKFIAWVKEVFITLQNAWSARDFDKCRPFEKEELYSQHMMQIQGYKDKGWINKLERINVNQAYPFRYIRDKEYEYLTVYIQARMSDYIVDEKTGNVIKGDPNVEYQMKYLYTFIRKNGVLTDPAKSNNSVVACPHCGAPTQITSAGKCEYCGFIVTTGEYDWVLFNIEAIHNETGVGNGGVFIR